MSQFQDPPKDPGDNRPGDGGRGGDGEHEGDSRGDPARHAPRPANEPIDVSMGLGHSLFVDYPRDFCFQFTISALGASETISLPPPPSQIDAAPASVADRHRQALADHYLSFGQPVSIADILPGDVIRLPGRRLLALAQADAAGQLGFLRLSDDGSTGFGALDARKLGLDRLQEVIAPRSSRGFAKLGEEFAKLPFERREAIAENVATLLRLDPEKSFFNGGSFYLTPDGRGARQFVAASFEPAGGRISGASAPELVPITLVYRTSLNPAESRIEGFFESAFPDQSLLSPTGGFGFSFDTDTIADHEEEESEFGFSGPDLSSSLGPDDEKQPQLSGRACSDLELAMRLASRFLTIEKLDQLRGG